MAVVYGLVHILSGRTYVGCTSGRPNSKRVYKGTQSKLAKRFREHRCLLNAKNHSEPVLQKDWLRDGPSAFRMVVLEETSSNVVAVKREAEIRWMRKLEVEGLLYNAYKQSFNFTPEATKAGIEASRIAGRWHNGVPVDHGRKISKGKRKARMLRQRNEIV